LPSIGGASRAIFVSMSLGTARENLRLLTMADANSQAKCFLADSALRALHRF
jgi:hypothetical protein